MLLVVEAVALLLGGVAAALVLTAGVWLLAVLIRRERDLHRRATVIDLTGRRPR
jgi:hypothetical protein